MSVFHAKLHVASAFAIKYCLCSVAREPEKGHVYFNTTYNKSTPDSHFVGVAKKGTGPVYIHMGYCIRV